MEYMSLGSWVRTNNTHSVRVKLGLLGILLAFMAMLSWIYRLSQNDWSPGDLGLVSAIPWPYFAALVFFGLAYILLMKYSRSDLAFMVTTVLLIIVLYATPTLIEGSPRFAYTYRTGGVLDYILRTGHSNSSWYEIGLISMYQNWPALFYLAAFVCQIAGASVLDVLLYTPVVSQLLYLAVLYYLFSSVFEDHKKVYVSCALFFLLNWVNQDYFTSQNMGLLLMFLILGIFFRIRTRGDHPAARTALIVVLFLCLVITHALSSIALYLCLLLFFFVAWLAGGKYGSYLKVRPREIVVIVSMTLVLLVWSLLGATSMMWVGLNRLSNTSIMNFFLHFSEAVRLGTNTAATQASVFLMNLKIADAGLFLAIGLAGLAYYGYTVVLRQRRIDMAAIVLLCLLVANALLYMTPLYSDEAIIRIFLFSILSLSYFAVALLDDRKLGALLLIFIVVAAPLHLLLHYGKEQTDYVSPASIRGMEFVFDTAPSNATLMGLDTIDAFGHYEAYLHEEIQFLKDPGGMYDFQYPANSTGPRVVVMSDSIRNYGSQDLTGAYERQLSQTYDAIYVAGDMDIYVQRSPAGAYTVP